MSWSRSANISSQVNYKMQKPGSGSSHISSAFHAQPAPQGQFNRWIETRPAPPVYRPQQIGKPAAQQKSAAQFRIETRVAPPVYRPGTPLPAIQAMETRSKSKVIVTRELPKGREQKVAFKHAMQDIKNGNKVFGDIPQEIQLEIQKLTRQLINPYAKTGAIKKVVKGKYIVSVGNISKKKDKRSLPTPEPLGTSKETFRMIGTVDSKTGLFQEKGGTNYQNLQPEGVSISDTETQRSHIIPSMLLNESDRVMGNSGVKKFSFVNQTYDRGSEEQIFKEAQKMEDPVFVGIEMLEDKKE